MYGQFLDSNEPSCNNCPEHSITCAWIDSGIECEEGWVGENCE